MKWLYLCLVATGCSGSSDAFDLSAVSIDLATQTAPDLATQAAPDLAPLDSDDDGIADTDELALASGYLPYLSLAPMEHCPVGGLLVRVRPHPKDATLVQIIYDHLYDADCGLQGHDGDDEVFGITVDPSAPPPKGLVAMRAVSHQGTACERDSVCGVCDALNACQTLDKNGVAWPAVWSSQDKHGSYVDATMTCAFGQTCLDTCVDNPKPDLPPMVNAGEPDHPLVHDLTDEGFITTANGWTHMELFHFDPWKPGIFGGAGDISKDLVDDAFLAPPCHAQ